MTSKQKSKGNLWEREICGFLGETLGGNFMRVPNSGAYMGGKNVFRKATMSDVQQRAAKGDIIPPDDLPLLNIEAKNYADIAFHQIIDGNCKQLDTWIDQTEEPADDHDISFTIFKITRKGSWVAFKAHLLEHFDLTGLSYVTYRKSFATDNACDYIIVSHKEFFTQNKGAVRTLGAVKT
jgi:Holliday junction resolvase